VSEFAARQGVEARFGTIEFGVVEQLDIGEYADPTQFELQYYVFSQQARQDVVRYRTPVDAGPLVGKMADLLLTHEGAAYRVEAVCVAQQAVSEGLIEYVFEAQLRPEVAAPAQERHGVDNLAAALLLDALDRSDD
jgi:hypothetical protein